MEKIIYEKTPQQEIREFLIWIIKLLIIIAIIKRNIRELRGII